jgi:hypothetical protein
MNSVEMLLLLIGLVAGHLVGDFLLQPKAMAIHKSDRGWKGFGWCVLHCLIYTTAVCGFIHNVVTPLVVVAIFLSHFPIDRWSLASQWLKLIRGRTFEAAYMSDSAYREFDIAFTSIVYTVVDSTWHLLFMFFGVLFVV